MTNWLILLLFNLFLPFRGPGESEAPVLHLDAQLLGQTYCRARLPGRIEIRLDVQLRFTNSGPGPLILYRKCDQLLRLTRSRNEADALAKKYDEDWAYSSFAYPKIVTGKEPFPLQNFFVILRPGETHFLNSRLGFTYCTTPQPHCSTLAEDNYMRAVFGTWKDHPKLAEQLREKWRPFGFLWTDAVASPLLHFGVDENPKVVDCPIASSPAPFI